MSNTSTLTDELTGKVGIQTDHGGIGIGDLIVLLLDAVLLIYTAWRSYDFLTTTVPTGFEILALVCLLYTSPSPRDRTRSRMPSSA